MRKILVIGLDAATFDLIRPWANQGKLPFLRKLIEQGSSGELTSVEPPITPSAWASAMSGKNPGQHGIFEFTKREENSYSFRPINRQDIKNRLLWQIVSQAGKKVGIVNDPLTYPPDKVNGFHITANLAPSEESPFIYPVSLKEEIIKKFGRYRLQLKTDFKEGKEEAFFNDVVDLTKNQAEVTSYLMKKYDWDLLIFNIMGTDTIPHRFWKFMDKTHPDYDSKKAAKFGSAIEKFYQLADRIVKEIFLQAGPEVNLIVFSDHGMGPLYKSVHLNNWLLSTGLMRLKKDIITRFKHWFHQHGFHPYGIYWLLSKFDLAKYLRKTTKGLRTKLTPKFFLSFSDVDWSRTKAYSVGNQSQIYLNLKSREPKGIVEPQEYKQVREEIITKLHQLTDPQTNEKIVDYVIKKEEVYSGPFQDQGPDLLVVMKGLSYRGAAAPEKDGAFGSKEIITKPIMHLQSSHRKKGIFMAFGPAIKNGSIEKAQIMDLAPTILYCLGLNIPNDMEGRVLKEIFQEDFLKENPIQHKEMISEEKRDVRLSQEEQEKIKEKLKTLGYLG